MSGLSGVDPLWVLWHAMGEPPTDHVPQDRTGTCSRCGARDDHCTRVKVVVSDKFTGWDQYTDQVDPLWCRACTWGHSSRDLRTRAWRVGPGYTVQATPEILSATLSEPLAENVALVVPLSRHKHLLPAARWGHLTTDDRTATWATAEVERLQVVAWLRGLGFSEAALLDPVPRFETFMVLNQPTMELVLRRWTLLAGWRKDPALMRVACLASRTPHAEAVA